MQFLTFSGNCHYPTSLGHLAQILYTPGVTWHETPFCSYGRISLIYLCWFSDEPENYFWQLCKEKKAKGSKWFLEVKILHPFFRMKTCGMVAIHQTLNYLCQRHVVLFFSSSKETSGCWVALAAGVVPIWVWGASLLLSAQTSSLCEVTSQHLMSFKSADKVVAPTERVKAFIQAKAMQWTAAPGCYYMVNKGTVLLDLSPTGLLPKATSYMALCSAAPWCWWVLWGEKKRQQWSKMTPRYDVKWRAAGL